MVDEENTSAQLETQVQAHDVEDMLARMPVAVAWASAGDGRIQFINRKFTAMFGYTLADLTTVHEWISNCYANPEQARMIDSFWQARGDAMANEQVEIDDVELDILCKDGSIKTVLSGKISLPGQAGALSTFLDITPRKEKENLIRRQAMEDALTGLLNRRAFSQSMERCLEDCRESGGSMALMIIDLDGFKQVNDTWGHDQGDNLLKQVATRLRIAVRDQDALCRIGGDEFCVVANRIGGEQTARVIAERILHELGKPYLLGKQPVSLTASIGISLYPSDGANEQRLFKHADEAMYQAKQSGKGRWCR